jgi:4-diphosphocytidyl-2-C-methyl-D-erythritol kinase
MAAAGDSVYCASIEAEFWLKKWIQNPTARAEELVFNNMERVAFRKFVALPTLLETLRARFHVTVGMSGSGSACFALLEKDTPVSDLLRCIREAWGPQVFAVETRTR